MMDMRARFLRILNDRRLVSRGDIVLVAVSGGVDSVVLLHLFRSVSEDLQLDVRAAHFDHAMRSDSADDAAFVAAHCKAANIPLVHARAIGPLAGENAARAARYGFLKDAIRSTGAARVATGHHADDQIETVLFRLMRGAGMRGLAGIALRRGAFIRPLLRFRKNLLYEYAAAHCLEYRDDPTNEHLAYARNRIRHQLLPALARVRPDAPRSVLELARHAARIESRWRDTIRKLAASVIVARDARTTEVARAVMLEYDRETRARVLRHVLRRHGVVPGRSRTADLLDFCTHAQSGAVLRAAQHVTIERAFDRIRIVRTKGPAAADQQLVVAGANGTAGMCVGGCEYDVEWMTDDVPRTDSARFDASILAGGLEMRGWRAGDRIALPYGTKKLKKLFAERRIAVSDRERIPILADQHGRVLWVAGIARSVHALPPGTGPALNIMVKNAQSR